MKRVKKYASLVSARRNVVIEGGSREITTEDEALGSLKLAHALASDLILPQFKKTNDLTNRIFRDLFYLSLSYVDSIADGVADEYISKERALDSKVKAVAVAKEGLRVREHYLKQGINQIGTQNLENMGMQLANVDETLMRPFEIVATSPKKVHRKEELTEKIKQELIRSDPLYLPSVIFPIAHGGNELGIVLSNLYEDNGHKVITYPLMFSIKTRKQRHPWVQHDGIFLDSNLENKNFLVTEDWVTTGNTLRGILIELEKLYPRETRIVTLKRDPEKSKVPFLDKYNFLIGQWARYDGKKTDSITDMEKA